MDIYTTIHFKKCWFCDEICLEIGLCQNCKYERIFKKKKFIIILIDYLINTKNIRYHKFVKI